MNKYVCVHGHFYQPPRENPWLEEIEVQDSAYPYHDWNARITAECYGPNALSRILDDQRKIIDIVNNYSKISFNFGPTLMNWLEKNNPEVYTGILDADKKSREYFSGHGSAIAQVYNHIIMPLANSRDKRTQVLWGIKDFQHRFKRMPEGMWLSETAVDLETLDILAEHGIKFTILAPNQAKRTKSLNGKTWHDVSGSRIDPKLPYVCKLPSGRAIVLFFYDGPISQSIAFGGTLESGYNLSGSLMGAFTNEKSDQLVHIATDGETYGHHHRFGDMALAYCIYHIESEKLAKITVYGEYLEKHPPENEVEIFENSSWSCSHGIERWRANCGCNSGMHPGWQQEWRAPLRNALDWLRDNLSKIYEENASQFLNDPWKARDGYIEVVLNRSAENIESFFSSESKKSLSQEEKVKVMKLLEMQRHAMLMYTSCGWFFDEISGIETVQILRYAARAMQLAKEVSGIQLEDSFRNLLKLAPSNIKSYENGEKVYDIFVKPEILDLMRVGVHFAVSSLFKDYKEDTDIYNYEVKKDIYEKTELGKQKLAIGKFLMKSDITLEADSISFAVIHLGDHNIVGGARVFQGEEPYKQMQKEIKESFLKADISEVIRQIDKHFEGHSYSLRSLFRDEQREVLRRIFSGTIEDIETSFKQLYEHDYASLQVMESFGVPLPKYFINVAEFVVGAQINDLLDDEVLNIEKFEELAKDVKEMSLKIDKERIGLSSSRRVTELMQKFSENTSDIALVKNIINILRALRDLSVESNLWEAQNIYFNIGKKLNGNSEQKISWDELAKDEWMTNFNVLGDFLGVRI